jgi:very-short-patch-repair endonuclease
LTEEGVVDDNGTNNEYIVHTCNNRIRFLDFYIPELKCCIEFMGDYWHSEKFRKGNKQRDAIREEEIKNTITGINILYINEKEYKKDKVGTINKCMEFINELRE